MNTDYSEVVLTKQRIRSRILPRLRKQKEEARARKSGLIKRKLFRSLAFRKAKTVMFYIAFGGEVDTSAMIQEAQAQGKMVTVPFCRKNRILRPCAFDKTAKLRRGLYGVYEPAVKKCMRMSVLDLVVVPGLAFDRTGNRLGRGKGCYDSFLRNIPQKTTAIGLAFDFQILPSIPTTRTDVSVDRVLFA